MPHQWNDARRARRVVQTLHVTHSDNANMRRRSDRPDPRGPLGAGRSVRKRKQIAVNLCLGPGVCGVAPDILYTCVDTT